MRNGVRDEIVILDQGQTALAHYSIPFFSCTFFHFLFFLFFSRCFFPLPTSLRERRNDHCLIRPAQKSWVCLREFSNFSDVHEFRTNGAGRCRKLNHLLVLREDSITSEKKKKFYLIFTFGKGCIVSRWETCVLHLLFPPLTTPLFLSRPTAVKVSFFTLEFRDTMVYRVRYLLFRFLCSPFLLCGIPSIFSVGVFKLNDREK